MTIQVFYRAVPADHLELRELAAGARQLTGRLVPYDTPAHVLDVIDGQNDIYQEGFRRGAFDGQLTSSRTNKGVLTKIGLIHRHEGGLGYLGPFVGLREQADGLYGDVKVLPTKASDVASLISEGIDELSIEFRLRPGVTNTVLDAQGVRWRTGVHLDQVALEPKGAYSTAQVLAYRAELDELASHESEAEAEAKQRAEQEEAEAEQLAKQREAAEAEAEAVLARRRAFAELTARLDPALERQTELEKKYRTDKTVFHADGRQTPPTWDS